MKESENMIVLTDPRPWKKASDQEFPPRRTTSVPFSADGPGGGGVPDLVDEDRQVGKKLLHAPVEEVEKPVEEGDRKKSDDHAGHPPADLRLPAEELDDRVQ